MANYNFTIRATDSVGAFADQPFSINVQRTRIDRFAALGTSPSPTLFRSPDGVKWAAEAIPLTDQYDGLVWSNDRWIAAPVAYSAVGNPVLTSVDLINWKSTVINLPKGIYQIAPQPNVIRYRSGKWFCYASALKTTSYYDVVEFTSDDFVTWTQTSVVFTTPNIVGIMRATDFQYDAASDTTVVAVYGNAFTGAVTRVGTGAWVQNPFGSSAYPSLHFLNGLWVYASIRNLLFMSRNGIDWFSRVFPSVINGVVYTNGKLVAASANSYMYTSADAGLTWTASVGLATVYSQSRRVIAAYGGQIVVAPGTGALSLSSNAGAVFTYTNFPGFNGINSIYSRT